MAFNDELQHDKLFNAVKEIYSFFDGWVEFNPTMCDPKDIETVNNISKDVYKKLQSIIQELDTLHDINVNSYGC